MRNRIILGTAVSMSFALLLAAIPNFVFSQGGNNATANQSGNWTGSASLITFKVVTPAILSRVTVDLNEATDTALKQVGDGSKAIESNLRTVLGYLVYAVSVVDKDHVLHSVLVDPVSGKMLDDRVRPSTLYAGPGNAGVLSYAPAPSTETNSTTP